VQTSREVRGEERPNLQSPHALAAEGQFSRSASIGEKNVHGIRQQNWPKERYAAEEEEDGKGTDNA
jgi:hypothetical protein